MSKSTIAIRQIAHGILHLRGRQVMLDYDLAALYGVEARALNQAVKRNASRFPSDFMFQLTREEMDSSQTVMTSRKYRGKRYRPYAFSEQGVAMLSSVLKRALAGVVHASRVLVSASRRNDLLIARRYSLDDSQSPRWRDAIANARDARSPRR
jgi:hypothetical protein